MRYIVFEDFGGKETPFLFPDRVEFVDMREQMPYTRVISCGEVRLEGARFTCSGGDQALGVIARSEADRALIAESLRLPGE